MMSGPVFDKGDLVYVVDGMFSETLDDVYEIEEVKEEYGEWFYKLKGVKILDDLWFTEDVLDFFEIDDDDLFNDEKISVELQQSFHIGDLIKYKGKQYKVVKYTYETTFYENGDITSEVLYHIKEEGSFSYVKVYEKELVEAQKQLSLYEAPIDDMDYTNQVLDLYNTFKKLYEITKIDTYKQHYEELLECLKNNKRIDNFEKYMK